MVKYFKTVSTSIDTDTFKKFKEVCKGRKCSPHKILKDYILDLIEMEGEKENVGEKDSGAEEGRQRTDAVTY